MNEQEILALRKILYSKELLHTGVQILENLSEEEHDSFRNCFGQFLYVNCGSQLGIYYLILPLRKEDFVKYNPKLNFND